MQAALGGDLGIAGHFNAESWLTAPTPDMRVYEIPEEEFRKAVAYINKEWR